MQRTHTHTHTHIHTYDPYSQTPDGELKSLIFDVRGNPGGLLTSAVDVAELVLNQDDPIVSTKGR